MAYLACSAFLSKNWRGSGIVNASYTPASSLGVLVFQNGGESNENTLGMRLTNTRYINSPGQGQSFFRLFPRVRLWKINHSGPGCSFYEFYE